MDGPAPAGPFHVRMSRPVSAGLAHKGHPAVTPDETGPGTIRAMHQMIELHPKADALDVLGLPAIPYPVALPAFQAAVANDGDLPLADMLRGLQLRAADADIDWRRLEPAMARLSELLAGDDERDTVMLAGDGWRLEAGATAASAPLLTLQRDGDVVAAAARSPDCLHVTAYRPLDAGAIAILLRLASGQADGASGTHRLLPCDATQPSAAADAAGHLPAARRAACVAAEIRAFLEHREA